MEEFINYAKSLNANQDVLSWLETTGKKSLKNEKVSSNEIEHIIDWLVITERSKCLKMSIDDALRLSKEWSEKNKNKPILNEDEGIDTKVFIDFDDGFSFKELLTKKAFQNEGSIMSHCLGGYNPSKDIIIYSLRDSKNKSHCTIEVRKNSSEVVQVKGKGNGSIHPKYVHYVIQFFEKIGMKIRKEEMKNLGYYWIYDEHIDFVKRVLNKNEKLVDIKGIHYVFGY